MISDIERTTDKFYFSRWIKMFHISEIYYQVKTVNIFQERSERLRKDKSIVGGRTQYAFRSCPTFKCAWYPVNAWSCFLEGGREGSLQFHLWGFRKWQNNGCIYYSWPTLRFLWSWIVRHMIISLKPPLQDRALSVGFWPLATTSPHLDFFYDLERVLQWTVHIFNTAGSIYFM